MVAVQRIAAAAEIVIIPVGRQHIVNLIVKALKAEGWPVLISLRRVIKDYIQNHFNPVFVKLPDKLLKLRSLPVVLFGRDIVGIRGKKSNGIIPPVVKEPVAVLLPGIHGLVKCKNRHQLYCVDSQLLQIRNLLFQTGKGPPMLHSRGGMLGKAPYMKLIDNQIA